MFENEMRNLMAHLGENWTDALLYEHFSRACDICTHEADHVIALYSVERSASTWRIASDMVINADLPGVDDALMSAPGVDEARWSDVNRKFCELFR